MVKKISEVKPGYYLVRSEKHNWPSNGSYFCCEITTDLTYPLNFASFYIRPEGFVRSSACISGLDWDFTFFKISKDKALMLQSMVLK